MTPFFSTFDDRDPSLLTAEDLLPFVRRGAGPVSALVTPAYGAPGPASEIARIHAAVGFYDVAGSAAFGPRAAGSISVLVVPAYGAAGPHCEAGRLRGCYDVAGHLVFAPRPAVLRAAA